jgi:hypothetical protein
VRKIPLFHNDDRNIQVTFVYDEGFDQLSYSMEPPSLLMELHRYIYFKKIIKKTPQ